jgi:hypothetical protein
MGVQGSTVRTLCIVVTGGGEALAIGAEGHTVNTARVAAQGQTYLRRQAKRFLETGHSFSPYDWSGPSESTRSRAARDPIAF